MFGSTPIIDQVEGDRFNAKVEINLWEIGATMHSMIQDFLACLLRAFRRHVRVSCKEVKTL